MNTLIHADIFFFISTIALIVISLCVTVILVYAIIIIRDFSHIARKVKEESMEIIEDVRMVRGDMKRDGFRFTQLIRFFSRFGKKRRAPKQEQPQEE